MNLHPILCYSGKFLCWSYSDDAEGCSFGQLVIDNFITAMHPLMHNVSCRGFFAKHQITQVTQPSIAQIWLLQLLVFPKTKTAFEREEISDHQWDSGKYDGAGDGDWENCVRSHGAYFEGKWGVIVLCTMFLVSWIFFNKCFYFSCYMAGYLLDRPHTFRFLIIVLLYCKSLAPY